MSCPWNIIFLFSTLVFYTRHCIGDQSFALCEGQNGFIRCLNGKRIQILTANYGRTDSKVCPTGKHKSNRCRSVSSASKVKWACNGYKTCHLRATSNHFGNPCHGITKYLEITFQCTKLQKPDMQKKIAFHAQLASTISVGSGTNLVFTNVVTNTRNAYNSANGKFSAPKAGVYRFDWSFMVNRGQMSYVCGVVNDKIVQYTCVNDVKAYHTQASGFLVVELKKGDHVNLKTCHGTSFLYHSYSFFAGHII